MPTEKITCRTVFFDAGMTLIRPAPKFTDGIRMVLSEQGYHVELDDLEREGRAAIARLESDIRAGLRYAISDHADHIFWGDVYEELVRNLGVRDNQRETGLRIYKFYQRPESFDLFVNARSVLETLSSRGFRLGVISNFSTALEPMLSLCGIRHYFDPLIVSAAEGVMKPDRGIFDLALSRAGERPGQAVMIGDNPLDDVQGAAAVGIKPILIDRLDRYAHVNVTRIRSLAELPDLLSLNGNQPVARP